MSKIVENIYGQKYVSHSCRFPEETFSYIHKMSQRRRVIVDPKNETMC